MIRPWKNVVRQGDILRQLTKTINKLSLRVEQIASRANESIGNSNAWMQTQDEGENFGASKARQVCDRHNTIENRQSSGLYLPKTIKIDFPCCEGKGDRTIWLCKADQFFGTPRNYSH